MLNVPQMVHLLHRNGRSSTFTRAVTKGSWWFAWFLGDANTTQFFIGWIKVINHELRILSWTYQHLSISWNVIFVGFELPVLPSRFSVSVETPWNFPPKQHLKPSRARSPASADGSPRAKPRRTGRNVAAAASPRDLDPPCHRRSDRGGSDVTCRPWFVELNSNEKSLGPKVLLFRGCSWGLYVYVYIYIYTTQLFGDCKDPCHVILTEQQWSNLSWKKPWVRIRRSLQR